MKICSVTMSRTGDPGEWREAIDTVLDLVDSTLHFSAGEITDFSECRNRMLKDAAATGYDWAIMLDTDERIHIHKDRWQDPLGDTREAFRVMLALSPDIDIFMIPSADGSYAKERIFRLPAKGTYVGPTHEAWITNEGAKREVVRWISFSELPKTPEQYRAKAERDREILKAWTKDHPDDPRWWYYLGDTYAGLGMPGSAIDAFATCFDLNGWDEESAWAAYRAAALWAEEKEFSFALLWCTNGMQRRADFPELPWLAGWCCYQLGRYEQAVYWEHLAIDVMSMIKFSDRIIFRHPPAHAEGPWDVLRFAYRALGMDERAEHMEAIFWERKTERERGHDRS